MAIQEKSMGQTRPNSTTATSLYTPAATVTAAIIKTIVIANVTNLTAAFSLFFDDNGTTYDETTAFAWKVLIEGNTTVQFDGYYAMSDPAGNVAVQTDSANYLNFTAWGAEIS